MSKAGTGIVNSLYFLIAGQFPASEFQESDFVVPFAVGRIDPSSLRMSARFASLSLKKSMYSPWLKNALT